MSSAVMLLAVCLTGSVLEQARYPAQRLTLAAINVVTAFVRPVQRQKPECLLMRA